MAARGHVAIAVDRRQAAGFRLTGQHLAEPLGPNGLVEAAGACSAQNTPPTSAPLALLARTVGASADALTAAIETDQTILQSWTIRQSPHLFPTQDLPVFTTALLPRDEESWRVAMTGFVPLLDGARRTAVEMVDMTTDALRDCLDGKVLTKRELGVELGKRLPKEFAGWFEPDTFSNFTAVLVRPIALTGLFCIAPRTGNEASFVLTEQFLGARPPSMPDKQARAELVRRYLRCYGPSTQEQLAEWAGSSLTVASAAWRELDGQLAEVSMAGGKAWVHQDDLAALQRADLPQGVRMLPPYDPYLQQRDRTVAVPDTSVHKRIWKHTGNPGVVLVNGDAAALWRQQKKGRALQIEVEPLTRLTKNSRDEIQHQARNVAALRGCDRTIVDYPE